MSKDFFDRQETAQRNTRWLLLYYPIAVMAIVGSVYVVCAFVWSRGALWNPGLLGGVGLVTVLVIATATLLKIGALRSGGGAVAQMLGGTPVDPNTRDLDERKLLNVVEEMSIASGTPVPEVWVMRNEPGINAFAAGHNINDAAVAVTDGAMKLLTRDELQGVIAHEFSHILHGDMRLNTRVLGMLAGILAISLVGRLFMRTRGRKNPLPLIGAAMFVIGSLGFFFGKLIQSAVSRQREYLADSAAVQYTRNPLGLAGALKKIGGLAEGSVMLAPKAEEASHFFFANGVSGFWDGLMSTHPPLEKRIRLLDPAFDGKYPTVLPEPAEERIAPKAPGLGKIARPVVAAAVLDNVGAPEPQHLFYAREFPEKVPAPLYTAAHEPLEAMRLMFAMLLSQDKKTRATQLEQLQQHSEPTRGLAELTDPLPVTFRLPLVSLALPTLKRLSGTQYQEFVATLDMLVSCDKEVDLFEYTLKQIVSHNMERGGPRPIQYYSLRTLLPDCAVLLSALARVGHSYEKEAQAAFDAGLNALAADTQGMGMLELGRCGVEQIDEVLTRLAQGSPAIKKRVLYACAYAVAADNLIEADEAELLRAIAETLDCPIPPFIEGVA